MIGVIDVGGGLRGIYGAGVLDYCLDHEIHFDYGIGVSAGSANIASYIAGQKRRNYPFYLKYPFRKEYMSLKNYLTKKSYLDLDYVYRELSNSGGENPLNYQAFIDNKAKFIAVAYDVNQGKPHYFTKKDFSQDHYEVFEASCCIPLVCQPVVIDDVPYYDGGLGDPVPLKKALDDGCDKVVVILTKPKDLVRDEKDDDMLVKILTRKDPLAGKNMELRAQRYNESVAYAKELEAQGKALIVAPDDIGSMSTLTKDKETLFLMYNKGYVDGEKIKSFLEE